MQEYIKTILENLTGTDPFDASVIEELIALVDNPQNPYKIIDNLKFRIQVTKDIRGDRELFYYLYLSVAYLIQQDFKLAKEAVEKAVMGFRIRGFYFNESMGEWLFGIIHFTNSDNKRAIQACNYAAKIMKQLITQCEDENAYKKAEMYKKYLKQMEYFYNGIDYPKRNFYSRLIDKLMASYWTGSSSDRMSHDDTPLRNSQQRYLESQDQKTPYYNEAPEDKGNDTLDNNDAPTVTHIIIPVDMRALDDKNPKITLLKSDLFQKLAHYGEHIFPNNDQHETKPASEKNADYF
jgi:hypothetical protein